MAAASDVISNRPSLPLFNHLPTHLSPPFLYFHPACLSSQHVILSIPALVTSPSLSEWNDEEPCGRRRGDLTWLPPSVSLKQHQQQSAMDSCDAGKEQRAPENASGKAAVLQEDACWPFTVGLGHCGTLQFSLSLTVFNYLSSAISVVSHLLRDAPLWNSASTSFTFDFLVFST